jgi:hypothetical protein
MVGSSRRKRHVARRKKRRLWVAALCAASFVTGQMLFGEEGPQPTTVRVPSLLSEYRQAKSQIAGNGKKEQSLKSQAPSLGSPQAETIDSGRDRTAVAAILTKLVPSPSLQPPSLRTATDSPAKDTPLIVARPLPLDADVRPAVAQSDSGQKPLAVPTSSDVEEEKLPPIVPAWAVPRPGSKKKTKQATTDAKGPFIPSPAPVSKSEISNPFFRPASGPKEPLRIELGTPQTPSPAADASTPKLLPATEPVTTASQEQKPNADRSGPERVASQLESPSQPEMLIAPERLGPVAAMPLAEAKSPAPKDESRTISFAQSEPAPRKSGPAEQPRPARSLVIEKPVKKPIELSQAVVKSKIEIRRIPSATTEAKKREPAASVQAVASESIQTNAEAADFILYDHEFRYDAKRRVDTAELTPGGKKHLTQVALRLEKVPFPVVIEESPRNGRPELDQARRRTIVEQLGRLGVPNAEERVVIANAFPES